MIFTESNTVEQMIPNVITKVGGQAPTLRDARSRYEGESLGDELRPQHWSYVPAI